eukprot:m.35906 g.35906  ORF g.35906 m.35906 type:complete len:309 (+) comp8983_c0_seq1:283-1209(+)
MLLAMLDDQQNMQETMKPQAQVVPSMEHNLTIDTNQSYQDFFPLASGKTPFIFNGKTPVFDMAFWDSSKLEQALANGGTMPQTPSDLAKLMSQNTPQNATPQQPSSPLPSYEEAIYHRLSSQDDMDGTSYNGSTDEGHRSNDEGIQIAPLNPNRLRSQRVKRESSRESSATIADERPKKRSYVKKQSKSTAGKKTGGTQKKVQPLDLPKDGPLPPDHMPARGRRRKIQLQSMTPEQIKAEAEARMEKNRRSARDCRRRKKNYIMELDNQLKAMQDKDRKQQKQIQSLEEQLEQYRIRLSKYESQEMVI